MKKHWSKLSEEKYGPYEVSRFGSVRNWSTGSVLKSYAHGKGYRQVTLKDQKQYLVHRLVAIAFLVKPDHAQHVNHKDGDKTNNFVNNLEWVTPSQNNYHYHENKSPMTTPPSFDGKSNIINHPHPSPSDFEYMVYRYKQIKNEMLLIKGHVDLLDMELKNIFDRLGIQVD